jgi:hypothetical protein
MLDDLHDLGKHDKTSAERGIVTRSRSTQATMLLLLQPND